MQLKRSLQPTEKREVSSLFTTALKRYYE